MRYSTFFKENLSSENNNLNGLDSKINHAVSVLNSQLLCIQIDIEDGEIEKDNGNKKIEEIKNEIKKLFLFFQEGKNKIVEVAKLFPENFCTTNEDNIYGIINNINLQLALR